MATDPRMTTPPLYRRCAMSPWWRSLPVFVLVPLLASCSEGVLAVHGPVAAEERQLLFEALACMLVVVVPVIVLTLVFAWWFRSSNRRATYRPAWSYSGRIEFTIWVIPLLVVLFLAALSWSGSHELDPYKPLESKQPPLTVEVVSMDWKWVFIYPEQNIATVNELALPVGRPVHFRLTSATVMNSFFVPGIAGQIYTMAGMQTQLSLQVNDAGIYRGMSAQFSGDGFSDMHFQVKALAGGDFDAWVEQVRKRSAATLGDDAFDALADARKTQSVTYYGRLDGDVFAHALHLHDKHAAATPMGDTAMSSQPAKTGI